MPARIVTRCLLASARAATARRLQFDASAAGLRQPNRNCLLRRACTVFPFANVIHLFADELARLGRWSPAGAFRRASSLERGFLWHIAHITQVVRRVSCFQRQPLTLRAPRGSLPVSVLSREVVR
jgi:hypothetical protein